MSGHTNRFRCVRALTRRIHLPWRRSRGSMVGYLLLVTGPHMTGELDREHLQQAARDHLWMHFTRHSSYDPTQGGGDVPVIVRGEGAYLYDARGRRYLDGLAGLFVSQLGHGRTDLADAAARQARELRS